MDLLLFVDLNLIRTNFYFKGANNYTYDEIQIALGNCSNGDPITWLNDNWQKLIETVQTLATKYGQEHKENIVGTISAIEAREALKKHKANVWHAVTECIEQRQLAFNAIKSQGNYSREDIVTNLTVHHGNADLALSELNRVQLKPFLLKIFGSPAGAENESGNAVSSFNQSDQNIQRENEKMLTESLQSLENDPTIRSDEKVDILRDIEAIIGSMEEKQSKQTETILQTIENLVGNIMASRNSRPMSSASNFSAVSFDRIDVKSPIVVPQKQNESESNASMENDVKDFVSRHIQEIVPDVAAQVNKELIADEVAAQSGINERVVVQNFVETNDKPNDVEVDDMLLINEDVDILDKIDNFSNENNNELEEAVLKSVSGDQITQIETTSNNLPIDQHINTENHLEAIELSSDANSPIVLEISNEPTESVHENGFNDPTANLEPATVVKLRSSGPKFVLNKASARNLIRQNDKKRIRELEKQLKKQKRLSNASFRDSRSESQNTGYLSDSTVVPEENPPLDLSVNNHYETHPTDHNGQNESNEKAPGNADELIDSEVKTFSFSITEQENVETEEVDYAQSLLDLSEATDTLTVSINDVNLDELSELETDSMTWTESKIQNETVNEMDEGTSKDLKSRNLSELVQDTKNLIQQMKNEIDEDIAMSVSEFGADDNEEEEETEYYDDGSDYSDELGELDGEDQGNFDDSDGWIDTDDDQSNDYDEDVENENSPNVKPYLDRSSQSVESEQFVEAQDFTAFEQNNDNLERNDERINSLENMIFVENESTTFNSEASHDHEYINSTENASLLESENNINLSAEDEIIETVQIIANEFAVPADTVEIANDHDHLSNTIENSNGIENESMIASDTPAFLENIIEIQQSLQAAVVSLNIREIPAIEKSSSSEPDSLSPAFSESSNQSAPNIDENNFETKTEILVKENSVDISDVGVEPIDVNENAATGSSVDIDQFTDQISVPISADNLDKSNENSDSTATESIDTESDVEELSVESAPDDVVSDGKSPEPESIISDEQPSTSSSINETLVESYKYNKITVPVITQCSQSSINVMQLKRVENNSTDKTASVSKKKIPIRRISLSEPSAGIKNLQNELLNKQTQPIPKIPGKKPSKIVPPKLFFRSGLSSLTNKVSDLLHSKNSSKTASNKDSKATASTSSSTSTQPIVPKKKYYETCFSDDYQTSDDEKPIASKKIIPNLVKIVEAKTEETIDPEVSYNYFYGLFLYYNKFIAKISSQALALRILNDGSVNNYLGATLVVELVQLKFDEKTAIWAASQCSTVEQAIALLQQECELCTEMYPMNQIVSMLKCTHSCCTECAKNYFTIQVSVTFNFILLRELNK